MGDDKPIIYQHDVPKVLTETPVTQLGEKPFIFQHQVPYWSNGNITSNIFNGTTVQTDVPNVSEIGTDKTSLPLPPSADYPETPEPSLPPSADYPRTPEPTVRPPNIDPVEFEFGVTTTTTKKPTTISEQGFERTSEQDTTQTTGLTTPYRKLCGTLTCPKPNQDTTYNKCCIQYDVPDCCQNRTTVICYLDQNQRIFKIKTTVAVPNNYTAVWCPRPNQNNNYTDCIITNSPTPKPDCTLPMPATSTLPEPKGPDNIYKPPLNPVDNLKIDTSESSPIGVTAIFVIITIVIAIIIFLAFQFGFLAICKDDKKKWRFMYGKEALAYHKKRKEKEASRLKGEADDVDDDDDDDDEDDEKGDKNEKGKKNVKRGNKSHKGSADDGGKNSKYKKKAKSHKGGHDDDSDTDRNSKYKKRSKGKKLKVRSHDGDSEDSDEDSSHHRSKGRKKSSAEGSARYQDPPPMVFAPPPPPPMMYAPPPQYPYYPPPPPPPPPPPYYGRY